MYMYAYEYSKDHVYMYASGYIKDHMYMYAYTLSRYHVVRGMCKCMHIREVEITRIRTVENTCE